MKIASLQEKENIRYNSNPGTPAPYYFLSLKQKVVRQTTVHRD